MVNKIMRRFLIKAATTIGYVIQYGCIAHCTFEYIGDFVVCTGPSMEPTIYSNNILFTEHITPRLSKIDRGDVIIAKCPTNPKQHICKRVTGLPGDKIKTGFASSEIVPVGHVWLTGDNSNNSADSRTYGPVPQGLIRSRALCKIWPLNEIKMLTNANS